MPRNIVLVGQCGVDGPRLQQVLSREIPDVHVLRCNDAEQLGQLCSGETDLMLFNRELVGEFPTAEGVDLMTQVKQRYPDMKVMLVSDYPEAQDEAEAKGALPGFGKADLGTTRVGEAIRRAMD